MDTIKCIKNCRKIFLDNGSLESLCGNWSFLCWQQLSDFHKFHKTIEEAHQRNLEIAKQQQFTTWVHAVGYENTQNSVTGIGPQNEESRDEIIIDQKLLMPFDIITNNAGLNNIRIKDEIIEKITPNSSPCAPHTNNFKDDDNSAYVENLLVKPKGKRGRPRKLVNISNVLQNPKKRGRPKKNHDNSEEIRKPNNGKRGRPRKIINVMDVTNKGKRGRPRKVRVNEDFDCSETVNETENPVNSDQSLVQSFTLTLPQKTDLVIANEKNKDFTYKKHIGMIQKRKRKHKTLIRNYIATSVRCMSFLKK
ncbi:hypothetical protein DOY81_013424 [Sarcophaga bullata]|nr:hypothetical protein DOY81_013424 [Sarcophaga bullata]